MATKNLRQIYSNKTYEGAPAFPHLKPIQELERAVLANLLWEDSFYESGESIASRISSLVPLCNPEEVAKLAIKARNEMNLRHVPLLLIVEMLRNKETKKLVGNIIPQICKRPDDMTELLALYNSAKRKSIPAQVKKGLAKAFGNFDEYQLSKYSGGREQGKLYKLRDILRITHPVPKDDEQSELWKRLLKEELKTFNTWENEVKKNTKEEWLSLITRNKMGALALLRNLRNMINCGLDPVVIEGALRNVNVEKVFPYRFITAARYNPSMEYAIEAAMIRCLQSQEKLRGITALLLDVSGSMSDLLSSKSDITRMDAAAGLAILLREICENVRIFTFSNDFVEVPSRHGFALRDAVVNSQDHRGTFLGAAVKAIYSKEIFEFNLQNWYGKYSFKFKGVGLSPDRLIVLTDEQSNDAVPASSSKGYMINIASYNKSVNYGNWYSITGWSESVIEYIRSIEKKGGEITTK